MKAISIPKNKYEAEEERLAKLKCNETMTTGKLPTSRPSELLQDIVCKRSADRVVPISNIPNRSRNTKGAGRDDLSSLMPRSSTSIALETSTVAREKKALAPEPTSVTSECDNYNDDVIPIDDTAIRRQPSKRYTNMAIILLKSVICLLFCFLPFSSSTSSASYVFVISRILLHFLF